MDPNRSATLTDVASLSGLSVTTVSRVLNGSSHVLASTREKIQAAMDRLGYVPNMAAKGLRTRRSSTVYCLFPEIDNPYFTGIYQGLDQALKREGYAVFLCQAADSGLFVRSILERGADGVVFDSSYLDFPRDRLTAAGIPSVRVNASFRADEPHSVRIDVRAALLELFALLAGRGHRRVGLISYRDKAPNERLTAYDEACARFGFERAPGLVSLQSLELSKHEIGFRGMIEILDSGAGATAVMAENDPCAAGAMAAAAKRGMAIPRDLSIVGFDDSPAGEFAMVSLTTVRLPAFDQGSAAADMLSRLMRGAVAPRAIDLEYRLMPRDSVGDAR
jgi:DNA-binding LacI/PurR family transcriptional regulator